MNHRISAGVLVINQDKILLVNHKKPGHYDFWVAPGGGVLGTEDIESAAGALHMHGFEQSTNISFQKTKSTYGLPKPKKGVQKIIPSKPAQKVSNYEQPQGKFGLGIVIVLAFILIALLGVLVGVIFFKENLVEFFNNFF